LKNSKIMAITSRITVYIKWFVKHIQILLYNEKMVSTFLIKDRYYSEIFKVEQRETTEHLCQSNVHT
jgi:hypothetical protein